VTGRTSPRLARETSRDARPHPASVIEAAKAEAVDAHGSVGRAFAKSQFTPRRSVFQPDAGTTRVIVLQVGRRVGCA
jgi:hypothetical protein